MSNTVKGIIVKGIIGLCIIALISFCAIKATHKTSVSSDPVEKTTECGSILSPETDRAMTDLNTKGNWTFIPTNYRSFSTLRFNMASIPEILDRFEKEKNLDVRDWKIVYDPLDAYPHGLLIHHAPK